MANHIQATARPGIVVNSPNGYPFIDLENHSFHDIMDALREFFKTDRTENQSIFLVTPNNRRFRIDRHPFEGLEPWWTEFIEEVIQDFSGGYETSITHPLSAR